jgi:hypothetical protein
MEVGGGLIHTARAIEDTTMTFAVGNNIPFNPSLAQQSQIQNKHFRLYTENIMHIIRLLFLSRTDSDSRGSINDFLKPTSQLGGGEGKLRAQKKGQRSNVAIFFNHARTEK